MKIRTIPEIEKDIKETGDKIQEAIEERATLKADAEELKKTNRDLQVENIGRAEKTGDLKTQRREVFELLEQAAELKDVVGYLNDKAKGLGNELSISTAFQKVEVYRKQEETFNSALECVRDAGANVNAAIEAYEESVSGLKDAANPNPQKTLISVLKQIKGKMDYEAFLSGEFSEPNPAKDNAFILAKITKYSTNQATLKLKLLETVADDLDIITSAVDPVGFSSPLAVLMH